MRPPQEEKILYPRFWCRDCETFTDHEGVMGGLKRCRGCGGVPVWIDYAHGEIKERK